MLRDPADCGRTRRKTIGSELKRDRKIAERAVDRAAGLGTFEAHAVSEKLRIAQVRSEADRVGSVFCEVRRPFDHQAQTLSYHFQLSVQNTVGESPARFDPGIGTERALRNTAEEGCGVGPTRDAIGPVARGQIESSDPLPIAIDEQLARPLAPRTVPGKPCGVRPFQSG